MAGTFEARKSVFYFTLKDFSFLRYSNFRILNFRPVEEGGRGDCPIIANSKRAAVLESLEGLI